MDFASVHVTQTHADMMRPTASAVAACERAHYFFEGEETAELAELLNHAVGAAQPFEIAVAVLLEAALLVRCEIQPAEGDAFDAPGVVQPGFAAGLDAVLQAAAHAAQHLDVSVCWSCLDP